MSTLSISFIIRYTWNRSPLIRLFTRDDVCNNNSLSECGLFLSPFTNFVALPCTFSRHSTSFKYHHHNHIIIITLFHTKQEKYSETSVNVCIVTKRLKDSSMPVLHFSLMTTFEGISWNNFFGIT